jgi:chemotaxis family two-component system response regulator Rcp1
VKISQIVLIEDNPADVLLVRMALQKRNIPCELTCFDNGEAAVQVLCEPSSTLVPDAILLDLNTPRSEGFEVLAKLLKVPRFSAVPVAVFTSSQATSDKHRAGLEGARYIEKHSQLTDFLETVGNAIEEMLHRAAAAS